MDLMYKTLLILSTAMQLKNILFDNKLHFKTKLIGYKGDDSWIEGTIKKMKSCLDSDITPDSNKNCEHCRYVLKANL